MEKLNLHELSLLLDQDIVVIQEDARKHHLKDKLKAMHGPEQKDPPLLSAPEIPEKAPVGDEYQEELLQFKYEGNFDKGVLVIYQGNNLEPSHREFLMKILGAVGCSLKDVALMSSDHVLELPSGGLGRLNPHKLLVFGSFNHELMKFKKVNYACTGEETVYFFADDLGDLADNIHLKKELWKGLQVLFNIKK